MRRRHSFIVLILSLCMALSLSVPSRAELTLPSVISDNMVLQQGKTVITVMLPANTDNALRFSIPLALLLFNPLLPMRRQEYRLC